MAGVAVARVRVILWFDTEDYLLRADDDAILRLARFLTREGIRAVFKMVGEKARVLVRRGRRDVIAALKRHEIGFHTDFHSVHPTPAEYLSALGWDEGVEEFLRREGPGYEDVRRIFGVRPACYGQPGNSWGPQAFGAMRRWKMPVYMDSGWHVGLDGRPHYYGGALTFFRLAYEVRVELGASGDVEEAQARFAAARKVLLREGGGVVSTVYHPNEFVQREFWDVVNFARGANPPRARWKPPRQKTRRETETAFANFEAYIRHLKTYRDVEFITTRDAARIYRDRAVGRRFAPAELRAIARAVGPRIGFQRRNGHCLAPADVFALLTEAAACGGHTAVTMGPTPFGPSDPPPVGPVPARTDVSQLARTIADVTSFLRRHGRLPSAVWLGSAAVTPEVYLRAVATWVCSRRVAIRPARLATARYVAKDAPWLWRWPIARPGFTAPAMMALAKRQAWTLKPAIAS